MSGLSIAPDCKKLPAYSEEKYEGYIKKTKFWFRKNCHITSEAILILSIPCKEKMSRTI